MMLGQGRFIALYWHSYDWQAELYFTGISIGSWFIGVART
jgi:hypothetical protein